MLGWMATRSVAAAEKRMDELSTAVTKLQADHHGLEKHISEQYISRPELTHRFSLIDAHIERLGGQVQEGTVILKSLEVTLNERYKP
jgi:peptidoglycan hydrolase CwlO-like protein